MKVRRYATLWLLILTVGVFALLSGCGKGEGFAEDQDKGKGQSEDISSEKERWDGERETVTLYSGAYGAYLKDLVTAYNQESERYEIVVQTAGAGEDVQTFRNRVQAELSAGEGPDLLDVYALQNLDYVPYAQKGFLLELTEVMKDLGEIPEKVMACNRWEDGIYGLPSSFYLSGLLYVRDLNVAGEEWNAQRCMQALEDGNVPYFCARIWNFSAQDMGNYVLSLLGVGRVGIQLFVEEWEGTCHFDSAEFKQMLSFAKEHLDESGGDAQEKMLNGEAFFSEWNFGSFRNFWEASLKYQGKQKYIGYPSPKGEVYGVRTRGLYVNARTEHLEGVKDFLAFVLSDQEQEKIVSSQDGYFPARLDVLQKLWKEAQKEVSDDIWYVTDAKGEVQYKPRRMTEEEEQLFWHMLDCSVPFSYQNAIDDIVCEETPLYFTGEKGEDEVAKAIQSRVQNYLNER